MFVLSSVSSESLISPDNTWAIWTLMTIGVAVSIYLEQAYRWAARLSGPVLALSIAMILSNVRILPRFSPVYDTITDFLVPIAVSLLLFRANLIDIIKTSRTAFAAVQIAILGSVIGSFAAGFVMEQIGSLSSASAVASAESSSVDPMKHIPEMTGMMAASYIGGGVNFFATKEIYKVDDVLTTSLLVADNFVMAAAFVIMFWLAAAPWMRRYFPHPHSLDAESEATPTEIVEEKPSAPFSMMSIAKGIAFAVSLTMIATFIAQTISLQIEGSEETTSATNTLILRILSSLIASKFIWLTVLTIAAATLFRQHLGKIQGTEEIGGYLLYLFLFTIGIPSDIYSVIVNVPSMFVLCTVIAVFNLGLTLLIGRFFRMNLEELLLASNATLGGPPTAAAMAVSLGWKKLVTPGLLIGLWGYVVGTAIGVCIAETLRQFLSSAM